MAGTDVWGQIAVEQSQMYVDEGGVVKSRFADTVRTNKFGFSTILCDLIE